MIIFYVIMFKFLVPLCRVRGIRLRFKTVNPATEELIAEYETMDQDMVSFTAGRCSDAYPDWRKLGISERISYVRRLADTLRKKTGAYAGLITL